MDVDVIDPGAEFVSILDEHVSACSVFLAVIGATWLEARDEKNRPRLEDPADFVRIEIILALKHGVPIIPVLVDGAKMPRLTDLPDVLQPLAHRHALEVRHDHFGSDVEHLIDATSRVINTALMDGRSSRERLPPLEEEGTNHGLTGTPHTVQPPYVEMPVEAQDSNELTPRRLIVFALTYAYIAFALFISIERFELSDSHKWGSGILLGIAFRPLLFLWQLMNIFLLVHMAFVASVMDNKNRIYVALAAIVTLGVLIFSKLLLLNVLVAIGCSIAIYYWKESY